MIMGDDIDLRGTGLIIGEEYTVCVLQRLVTGQLVQVNNHGIILSTIVINNHYDKASAPSFIPWGAVSAVLAGNKMNCQRAFE
jgi:hypothetical protein